MNPVKEYVVVIGSNAKDLEIKVNQNIALGFVPVGGMCWNSFSYLQAMVR